MRRNRLLGLSFAATALAAGGAGGAALLLGSGTPEPEPAIRSALLTYANEHRSWAGVDSLVRQLAELTGQRIALTTPDGRPIADSGSATLPPAPATRIDAAAASPGSIAPQPNLVAGEPGRGAALSYYQWQLTDAEREQRQALAEQAVACLRANGPADDGGGEPVRHHKSSAGAGGTAAAASPVLASCVPDALEQPSAASRALAASIAERSAACLDASGLAYEEATDWRGLPAIRSEPAVEAGATWKTCTENATVAARREYVAAPADLYVGSAGDGRWRTAAIVAAALLAAVAAIGLAGRRLVSPIAGLAGVAHELRSPLANIRSHLEAANDGVLPLDNALIQTLTSESTLLERLVADLQDLALADAGRLRVHPEERDAGELAEEAVAAHQAHARAGGVELRVSIGEPVTVYADPARLRQALSNLVANAIRHTPEGGLVEVTVRRANGVVVLAVADSGCGIAPEQLPRVFDRFYRADPNDRSGAGLGLAIAKQLVEAHRGELAVTSSPRMGSTFTIRLPSG